MMILGIFTLASCLSQQHVTTLFPHNSVEPGLYWCGGRLARQISADVSPWLTFISVHLQNVNNQAKRKCNLICVVTGLWLFASFKFKIMLRACVWVSGCVASSAGYATLSLSGSWQAIKAQVSRWVVNKTQVRIFTYYLPVQLMLQDTTLPEIGIPMLGNFLLYNLCMIYSHAIISPA